ncbi:MAG: response regulator [Ignavibacteriaceae bacterium]|nr:response regulator [Ignavibacteriaceae bacterium]
MPADSKKTILVIDDDITIRKLLSYHLKNNGFDVFEAVGPSEAFAHLNQNKFDLVLCDVTMDEMDGFTFCKQVREKEEYKILPFIFVTAKSGIEDKEKAIEVGGDDFITKPFEIQELIMKVRALVRRADIFKIYGAKRIIEQTVSQSTPQIVLIDDDQSLAKLFQYNLNKSGFECHIAFNAEDGLKLIKKVNPDIIISDIMMPKIDGFQLRKMILEDEQIKAIPFIFLTSKGSENDILDGYDLGITDYVLKTAGPRVVVAKVSAIIKSLGKERQKVVSELHSAADSMKMKVVPDESPEFDNFQIKHWHVPFQGIPGGDFIDYFRFNENNLVVIFGDVMGKKWGAWYFAYAYAGYIRSSLRVALQSVSSLTPADILKKLNLAVYNDAKISEVFTTLSILVFDNQKMKALYSGAGDLPLIYHNYENKIIHRIQSNGVLLGFAPDSDYENIEITLTKNDILYLMSDGIIESRNSNGVQFGVNGLEEALLKVEKDQAPVQKFISEFSSFTAGKFEDDISLIMIKAL